MKQSMHTSSRLLIVLLALLVTACNFQRRDRDRDPEPDLSGTYEIVSVRVDSRPNPSASGTVKVSKISDSRYDVDITLNGQRTPLEVEVKKASGKTYDMYVDDELIGDIDGTEFRFDYTDASVGRVVIVARK